MRFLRSILAVVALGAAVPAAAQLVVITARGSPFKVGQRIDGARPIALKPGEQLTLIGPDGRSVTLRGPFAGVPMPLAAVRGGGRAQALAALVAGRGARSSAVGVVRSGGDAQVPPDPWLIDVSRSGTRCLKPGVAPIWWRPDGAEASAFSVFPVDRSWRADFRWAAGQDRMAVPPLARFDGVTTFVFRTDGEERLIAVERAPAPVDTDLMLASWLIEKGCTEQADALLRTLQAADDRP